MCGYWRASWQRVSNVHRKRAPSLYLFQWPWDEARLLWFRLKEPNHNDRWPQMSAGIREVKCLGSHLDLCPNEVQVWSADLDAFASREGAIGGVFSNDERERAFPLHF